jgi:hypothetical protein
MKRRIGVEFLQGSSFQPIVLVKRYAFRLGDKSLIPKTPDPKIIWPVISCRQL